MLLATKVNVKKAGRKGRGIFAAVAISAGEVIEIAPYINIPAVDHDNIGDSILRFYWYAVGTNNVRAVGLGYTSLYNHCNKPNAMYFIRPRSKTIEIVAAKNIRAGQEISIDYGYNPMKAA